MFKFNFSRQSSYWILCILDETGNLIKKVTFPETVSDEDITQMAITLAKGSFIETSINFK